MLDLWLIRHAQTPEGSQAHAALTADGEAQARALAPKLAEERFDLVFASPLPSARRTAELALPHASITFESRLRELAFTSRSFVDVTRLNAAMVRDPTTLPKSDPDAETGREFMARIRDWIESLPREGRVIAFTHVTVLRECLRQLRPGLPPKQIEFCAIHRVERS